MNSKLKTTILTAMISLSGFTAAAIGWPNAYDGVMLQAFYWDSYQNETKWTKLQAQADELCAYFDLIWVPNSAQSSGGLGYHPRYWFTNHNSDMGTESQLRSMINTFKAKGTGTIADVVINHRDGINNWADFPYETWNGKTWHIGLDGVCRDDEINNSGNPGGATGGYDTGEHYGSARDLDHTNANVQDNCKNYCKCLIDDYGYAGFRLDMVKGYSGQYTKMYNQYSKPTFSVGEYFDSSYDAVAAWIESTGGESAAFDFPFKYALNNAFSGDWDMQRLVWMENGETPKPAGMIHHWYQQLAVTFIDNHDTYRDDWNRFQGDGNATDCVEAANAFMLCSPGTPCVFLPHWTKYKAAIKRLIAIRKSVGVTNVSEVNVLQHTQDCYMAEVTGKNGKLAVKIGWAWVTPSGYSDSDIVASGTNYCVWTKVPVVTPSEEPTLPERLYMMGNLSEGHWTPNVGIVMTKNGSVYTATDVELEEPTRADGKAYFSIVSALGTSPTDWTTVNAHDRYGASTKDEAITPGSDITVRKFTGGDDAAAAYSWAIAPGKYDISVDLSTMKMTAAKVNSDDTQTGISAVGADASEAVYYNVAGQRVDNPTSGLYIVVRGGKASKVILK